MPGKAASEDVEDYKSNVAAWSYAAALSLLLLAYVLVFAPRLLLFLSEEPSISEPRTFLSPLEAFLARHLGIWLAAISYTLILNIPSYPPPLASLPQGTTQRHPLLGPATVAANVTALLAWNTKHVGSLATLMSFVSGTVGLWGLWTIVFGDTRYHHRDTSRKLQTS